MSFSLQRNDSFDMYRPVQRTNSFVLPEEEWYPPVQRTNSLVLPSLSQADVLDPPNRTVSLLSDIPPQDEEEEKLYPPNRYQQQSNPFVVVGEEETTDEEEEEQQTPRPQRQDLAGDLDFVAFSRNGATAYRAIHRPYATRKMYPGTSHLVMNGAYAQGIPPVRMQAITDRLKRTTHQDLLEGTEYGGYRQRTFSPGEMVEAMTDVSIRERLDPQQATDAQIRMRQLQAMNPKQLNSGPWPQGWQSSYAQFAANEADQWIRHTDSDGYTRGKSWSSRTR